MKQAELIEDTDKDHSPTPLSQVPHETHESSNGEKTPSPSFLQSMLSVFGKQKTDADIREALEEYIEGAGNGNLAADESAISSHERTLLSNILELKDLTVVDIMVPRADIVAIDVSSSQDELFQLLSNKQNSRIPVYRNTLDEVVGTIHLKDILATLAQGKDIHIESLVRDVPIVSPSMHVMDLLLMFRQLRKHMALVIDEYGGIDGLITIGDLIEVIVGEIDDEYDQPENPVMIENDDGSVLSDSRVDIDDFEDKYGTILTDEERHDVDTLGGLVFAIAGRIPARGEILTHDSGMIFEIIEAGPRRVNKILIRSIPKDNNAHIA